jgi:hypothetical protein
MERETQKEQTLRKFADAYGKKIILLSKEVKELKSQIKDMQKHIDLISLDNEISYIRYELIKLEFKQYRIINDNDEWRF